MRGKSHDRPGIDRDDRSRQCHRPRRRPPGDRLSPSSPEAKHRQPADRACGCWFGSIRTRRPSDIRIADLIESIREIWRPFAEIEFAAIGTEAAGPCDDELRLLITDRGPQPGSAAAAVLGSIEFLDGRPQNTDYRLRGSGADDDERRQMAGPHHRHPAAASAPAIHDPRAQPERGARDRSLSAAIPRTRTARPDAGANDRRGDHGRRARRCTGCCRTRSRRSIGGWLVRSPKRRRRIRAARSCRGAIASRNDRVPLAEHSDTRITARLSCAV